MRRAAPGCTIVLLFEPGFCRAIVRLRTACSRPTYCSTRMCSHGASASPTRMCYCSNPDVADLLDVARQHAMLVSTRIFYYIVSQTDIQLLGNLYYIALLYNTHIELVSHQIGLNRFRAWTLAQTHPIGQPGCTDMSHSASASPAPGCAIVRIRMYSYHIVVASLCSRPIKPV
jgi:hypothetical protein